MIKENAGKIALVALVIAIIALFTPAGKSVQNVLGGTTNYDSLALGQTLSVTGATTLTGLSTLNGGVVEGLTNSTSSTATAQGLLVADVQNYSTVLFTPNTATTTLTFFASSTATSWLPTAGNTARQCWFNATSTNTGITFVGGTGVTLMTASTSETSATRLTIRKGETGCFTFIRQPATASSFDISANLIIYNR